MTLRVERVKLEASSDRMHTDSATEVAVLVLTGRATVTVAGPFGTRTYPNMGKRADVFSGLPTTVLVGPDHDITLATESHVDALIFRYQHPEVLAISPRPPQIIRPQDVRVLELGEGSHRRAVRQVVTAEHAPYRLRIGETINPPGCWSSWPVHAGERDAQEFSEVFAYFTKPANGFGVQLRGEDTPVIVKAGDIFTIPQGFHPVVAGPDTTLLYVWCFVGSFNKIYAKWADEPSGLYAV